MIQIFPGGSAALNTIEHWPLATVFCAQTNAPAAGAENSIPTPQAYVPVRALRPYSFYFQASGNSVASGNSYPGIPMVTSDRTAAGLFFPSYGSSIVPCPANKWRMSQLTGPEDDITALDPKLGPYLPKMIASRMGYAGNLPVVAVGTGQDISIAVEDYCLTGIVLQRRDTSSTWWPVLLGLNPSDKAFPFTGNMRIRADNPFATSGNAPVAAAYVVNLFGFQSSKLAVPLKVIDVSSGALANTLGGSSAYSMATYETSAWFHLLGAYLVGNNSGNYYMVPWGFQPRDTSFWCSPEGRGQVIFANCLSAGQVRAHNAGDFSIRLVGIEVPPEIHNTIPTGYTLVDTYNDAYSTTQRATAQWGITLTHWADGANRSFSNADGEGGTIQIYKNGNDYLIRGGVYCLDYVFRSMRMHITSKSALLAKLGAASTAKIKFNRFHSWVSAMPANTGSLTKYDCILDRTDWPEQITLTGANLANVLESCYWNTSTNNPSFRNSRMLMMDAFVSVT